MSYDNSILINQILMFDHVSLSYTFSLTNGDEITRMLNLYGITTKVIDQSQPLEGMVHSGK